MIFGIIGNGFVGQATKILNNSQTQMLVYDIDPKKCEPEGLTVSDLKDCDIIFISVPTPMDAEGRNHLGIVKSVVELLRQQEVNSHIVIRSTVLPGTCDELDCYFMPEFLTEKNWPQDFYECENWIFGLKKENNGDFEEKIRHLYQLAFEDGKIKHNVLHFVSNSEAEMIKYFRNTYLSVKVSYCNEIYDYCQHKGINYENVRKLATLDKRIMPSHTQVPGHDGRRGFGGTCFPKDTNALLRDFEDEGLESYVLKCVVYRNEKKDRPEQDWKEDKGRASL